MRSYRITNYITIKVFLMRQDYEQILMKHENCLPATYCINNRKHFKRSIMEGIKKIKD